MENVLKVLDGWHQRRQIRNDNSETSQKICRALLVNCRRRGFDQGTVEKILVIYDTVEVISLGGRAFSTSYPQMFDFAKSFDELEDCPQKQSFAEYCESMLKGIRRSRNFMDKVNGAMRNRSGQITDKEIDSILANHCGGSMKNLISFCLVPYDSTLMMLDFAPSDPDAELAKKFISSLRPTVPYTVRKLYRDLEFTS